MSQVGPDDLVSNLSKWYSKLSTPPEWIKAPVVDEVWSICFALLAAITFIAFFVPQKKGAATQAKPPQNMDVARENFKKELEHKAFLNRQQLFGSTPAKPRYALPKEAEKIDIEKVSNQELGAHMSDLTKDIRGIFAPRIGQLSDAQVVRIFMSQHAPRFFWLYGEARRRGHKEPVFDHTYEEPSRIFSAGHVADLAKRLGAFADIVKLHA